MDIRTAIKEILNKIESGHVFDSHYVVNELIEKHTDEYLRFAAQYAEGGEPTLKTHQEIGRIIKGFVDVLVKRFDYESWSLTVHHTPGSCALWLKL
jgi:hypothetical protein